MSMTTQVLVIHHQQHHQDDHHHRHGGDGAEGLLLHPTVGREVDEAVTIQGRRIRFATVDLMAPTLAVRERLRSLVVGAA